MQWQMRQTLLLTLLLAFVGGGIAAAQQDVYAKDPAQNPLVIAAKAVSPSVVSIGGAETRYYPQRVLLDEFFNPFIVYQPEKQRIPYRGSGFIVHKDGYVVTNYHVIDGVTDIFVTLPDKRELKAQVLDADMVVDVALLRIESAEDLPAVKLGDSDKLQIGEWSMAIGNPFGNWIDDPQPTVTVGVVSALNRSFKPDYNTGDARQVRVYQGMIQTDAAINPGNSGGPLVNVRGEVVGVNTFIFSRVGGSHGIGFAIPVNRVKKVVDEIMTYGRIRDLRLDFDAINISETIALRYHLETTEGVLVLDCDKGGPAEKAGLQVGDAIVAIDGRPIHNLSDLIAYFKARHVGDKLKFRLVRNGQQKEVEYIISEK